MQALIAYGENTENEALADAGLPGGSVNSSLPEINTDYNVLGGFFGVQGVFGNNCISYVNGALTYAGVNSGILMQALSLPEWDAGTAASILNQLEAQNGGATITTTEVCGDSNQYTCTITGQYSALGANGTRTLLSDSWTSSDGSHGTDTYTSASSFTSTIYNQDKSSAFIQDVSGQITESFSDENGKLESRSFYNVDGQQTEYQMWNTSGQMTQDQLINTSTGNESEAIDYSNGIETDQINYSALYGVEVSDYQFNATGKETDAVYYAGTTTNNYETNQTNYSTANNAETSNVIFNSSSQVTEEQLFAGTTTGNYETNQINFSTLYGVETSDYQFNSAGKETDGIYFTGTATNDYETNQVNYSTENGAETSNYQFNSAGKETDEQDFAGTTSNNYETNQYNFSLSNGSVVSNYQYNSSGRETDEQDFAGTTANNYETNQYNFSLSNGAVVSNYQYNSSGKEADEQDFAGTTTNNYETNQYNFSLTNGAVVSNYQFNSSGQETGLQDFAGTTSNNYQTDQISFSTLNGLEISDLQYNQAGNETDGIYFSGTAGNNYETNQINFSTANGAEISNVEFGSSGQETEFLQYAGTTTNNYVAEMASFTPGANYANAIYQYNSAGVETQQDLFNSTTGQESSAMYFNTSTGLESQYDQFSTSGPYASQITLFNTTTCKETENEAFNPVSGAVDSLFLYDGVDPYATEELFSTGGSYFSQIDYFNAATGVQTSGAMFNISTGAETEYYSGGSWFTGGSGSLDSGDDDYFDDADMDDDDSWFDDDPIMLNLNGGAVQTTALGSSPATFDLLSNGQPVQTGWGTAGEGYLVYDPNDPENTVAVTQGSQLVAGMNALNTLAQQVDGIGESELTSSDALWNDLKVWVDTTGTGQFETGQLYSLSQLGITSLSLQDTQANQNDNGNQIVVQGTFGYANGTTGQMAGVNLAYSGAGMSGLTADQSAAVTDDVNLSPLVAAMAAYAVPASVSASLAGALQPDVSAMLTASAH